ncbi:MAG: hypothetical protein ACRDD7_05455 [Peptostreptococcaceae bacterium]
MKTLDITSKTITLLTTLSVVYALLEGNAIFLAPIITVAIPYQFIKNKEYEKYEENKKTLNNLFIFNIITFIIVSAISNKMSQVLLDTIINIFVSFVYLRIIWSLEGKQNVNQKNPEEMYNKLKEEIYVLEQMKLKLESKKESAKTEKSKSSVEMKLEVLNQKILQDKNKLELIKIKIESKEE